MPFAFILGFLWNSLSCPMLNENVFFLHSNRIEFENVVQQRTKQRTFLRIAEFSIQMKLWRSDAANNIPEQTEKMHVFVVIRPCKCTHTHISAIELINELVYIPNNGTAVERGRGAINNRMIVYEVNLCMNMCAFYSSTRSFNNCMVACRTCKIGNVRTNDTTPTTASPNCDALLNRKIFGEWNFR